MTIEIRPIRTHAEYRASERLQQQVWGLEEVEIVPDHLLITAVKNGGLLLGAFDALDGDLVGFVFGFIGLTGDGQTKHCSHMAGVAPGQRDRSIGYQLKLAQREAVLLQGIDLITWTFDPLETRNARLNFRKLGAVCHTYIRNLYGSMRDSLNVGLESDRFQVEWHIASSHVSARLDKPHSASSLAQLIQDGVRILNPTPPEHPPHPLPELEAIQGHRALVQVPPDFQNIKSTDLKLAIAWREQTRALFEAAFAQGYTAVDLLFEDGQSYYLLQRGWSADQETGANG